MLKVVLSLESNHLLKTEIYASHLRELMRLDNN